jgi:branched-chain amino acid transport system substrate-binding protein
LLITLAAGVLCLGAAGPVEAAKPSELKLAVVHFLSGAGAPHDEAAVNAAKLLTEQFNADGGIGGVSLSTIYVDEAGSTADKVAEFRRLVQDEQVDVVLGYTSSAHCLGAAPVAEELKTLTIFPICANYRLFEEQRYQYVFRTSAHAASENIAAAYYVLAQKPDLKTIAGLNYDYAYGRDSWEMFKETILKLKPDVEVAGEFWTQFLASDYSAEISSLLRQEPDVVHTVNWGAGLTAFIRVARTRGLFDKSLVVATTGSLDQAGMMPPGVAFSGRGYHLQSPDPGKDPLNRRFIESYREKFDKLPDYTGHFMAQGFYGLKAAYEKAIEVKGGDWPTVEEVIAVFRGLGFETPRGPVMIRSDHQAVHGSMWGMTTGETDPTFGYPMLDNLQVFPAAQVNPPLGVNPVDWIRSWPAEGQ